MAKTMGIFTRARLAFPTSSYVCRLGKFLARIPIRSGCELFYALTHQTLRYFKVVSEVENKVPEMILPVMIVVYSSWPGKCETVEPLATIHLTKQAPKRTTAV